MFNFLLHNCLMHWFWSILLLVTNIFIDIQATTLSWFFFCLLLSHSVLPIPGVPAAPELTSPSPIYNYHVLPGFVNSNPLASVSTCIHGSITYVIVMAYNIYWVIAIMCQELCNWYNCLSCLIQSTSNTHLYKENLDTWYLPKLVKHMMSTPNLQTTANSSFNYNCLNLEARYHPVSKWINCDISRQ